ncbi:Protein-S-isoprenylcysteine O-methyltransferase [Parasponia andersonii]|uniref:Protein-S-isoprenylcysteine O-methyltransferase n=1 Tax=Parasponia andersonii TaxID=3476 RepID=A0A2P5D4P9_PARAD|nr:Protein-S-isoprenylcysteine O-methyltransferase [Parasponia andersonii]
MTQVFTPIVRRQLSQMFLAELFFQISECVLAIIFRGNPKATLQILLFNKTYLFDMIFALSEYFIEVFLVPELKELLWISNLGLLMAITGEIIRKIAMITAGYAFTHQIRTSRDVNHQLVTHGIYKYMRHPGYSGYLIWSVGIQIMLCSPLSTIRASNVIWRFLYERILLEENSLRKLFGAQYDEYARGVPSGVPFVK